MADKNERRTLLGSAIMSLRKASVEKSVDAFDINADKKIINETLSRIFGLEELKKSRFCLYQAFNLQDENEKIQEKRNEETLLRDLHEKVIRIHRIHIKGHGKVVVCMPYNFSTSACLSL